MKSSAISHQQLQDTRFRIQDSGYHASCIMHRASRGLHPVSCIMHRASCIVFLILALLLPAMLYAAPQMVDYCYLPKFMKNFP